MDKNKLWEEALSLLSVKVTTVSYDVWIKNLEPYSIVNGNNLVLIAPTATAKNIVNKNYSDPVLESLREISQAIETFTVILEDEKDKYAPANDSQDSVDRNLPTEKIVAVTDKYTFDSFVVGHFSLLSSAVAAPMLIPGNISCISSGRTSIFAFASL